LCYFDIINRGAINVNACRTICAAKIIDPEIEGHYAFITSWRTTAGIHNHDFYELFLVVGGSARHLVNGQVQNLTAGSLVMIRPADVHYYQGTGAEHLNFINLAFTRQAAESCFNYLDGCLSHETLLQAPLPPHICLTGPDLQNLTCRLQNWNTIPLTAKPAKRAELRALLAELFTRYLMPWPVKEQSCRPRWLTQLMAEMNRREHLTVGLPALLALSGKSHEHLCREFRRHAGMTPTAFVCGLRLEYAANLLVNSNWSVLDILLDSGFENISHFNHCFRRRFGCSPRAFRQKKDFFQDKI